MGTTVYMWLGPGPRGQWWPSQAFSPIKYMLEGWLGRGGGSQKYQRGPHSSFEWLNSLTSKMEKDWRVKNCGFFLVNMVSSS